MTSSGGQIHPVVARAAGMVSVQAECAIDEAVVLMETCAVSTHATVEQIAEAVIGRQIRFGM